MTRAELFGTNIIKHLKGPNIGRLDRKSTAKFWSLTEQEISKAYNNWIQIFRMPMSTLTFEQYLTKMKNMNLGPLDIGPSTGQYHLSRYNDEGPYTNDSCRFILAIENLEEQKRTNPYQLMVNKYGKRNTKKVMSEAAKVSWNNRKEKVSRCS
jgi:hypothetical protein